MHTSNDHPSSDALDVSSPSSNHNNNNFNESIIIPEYQNGDGGGGGARGVDGSPSEKSATKIPNSNGDFKMIQVTPKHPAQQSTGSVQKDNLVDRTKKFLKGIGLTILSGLFFSITTLVVKYIKNVSPGTTAGFRYLGIIILAFPLALESSQPIFGLPGTFIWIALRGLAGGTSVFCRYSALQYMSMADSTIIILSMPVFVFVFARIFLKEPFGRFHILALLMSIAGIMFASKIEFIFGGNSNGNNSEYIDDDIITSTSTSTSTSTHNPYNVSTNNDTSFEIPVSWSTPITTLVGGDNTSDNHHHDHHFDSKTTPIKSQLIGTLYSLGSTFIGCFVYIIIRKLKSVDKYVILFNFSIISMIEMILIDYFFYDLHLPQQGITPYLIVLIGILSFYAQLLLTRAIQIEEAGVVSVVRTSSEAFFAFFLQIIFFGQIPDLFTIVGAILVLSAVFLLSFRKYVTGLPEEDGLRKRFQFLTK